jgi:hypothetical protein
MVRLPPATGAPPGVARLHACVIRRFANGDFAGVNGRCEQRPQASPHISHNGFSRAFDLDISTSLNVTL